MVMSGKGGVDKTTVAVNLALGLAMYGKDVGLMDADVTGPTVPKMLNIEDQVPNVVNENEIHPVELPRGMDGEIKVISMAFLIDRDSPVVWRSPLKLQVLTQLVQNVMWGHLDCMLVDLPPGTSDEPLSIAQLLKPNGAIVVNHSTRFSPSERQKDYKHGSDDEGARFGHNREHERFQLSKVRKGCRSFQNRRGQKGC